MEYIKELDAVQTWIKATAGLASYKLSEAKPKVARPVILWESPSRGKARNIGAYVYVQKVRQFGRLFLKDLNSLLTVQQQLSVDLEERSNVLPVTDGSEIIGYLKAVAIEFSNSDTLDVPFSVSYEVTYSKTKPVDPPNATVVNNRLVYGG